MLNSTTMTAEEYSQQKEKQAGCGIEFTTAEIEAAFNAGMLEMKQQMIKEALDAVVHKSLLSSYMKELEEDSLAKSIETRKDGNKVKEISVKGE
jgi:hypothetical protein